MSNDQVEVLIDTNVFIEREGDWVVSKPLQELEKNLKSQGHTILVHPESIQEVRNYENEEGRDRAESKIATYAVLNYPGYPKAINSEFRKHVPEGKDYNEKVDNALLFAVYEDRVDYLITQDKEIHRKARRLNVDKRVLSISEGREVFAPEEVPVEGPPSVKKTTVGELEVSDEIFDSLREQYPGFNDWFDRISDGDAYANWQPDGSLGAVLLLKPFEAETIDGNPVLPKRDRMKIRTLKVAPAQQGSKLGELLISKSIHEAVHHGLDEVYLTHYINTEDYLVQLISQYGFTKVSEKPDGEAVFVKRLTPGIGDDPNPFETHYRFYPSFYDGPEVDKYLIPIQPVYHGCLFPTYKKRHPKLVDFTGEFVSEGNAIKKAYLCHANIRKIETSDILLFYRSRDHQELTSLCVCERVDYGLTNAKQISELVGRRSVYTEQEIEELALKPTTVILFKWHFNLGNPISYQTLRAKGVLNGPLQTIQQIDEAGYEYIRDAGGVDERFIVN